MNMWILLSYMGNDSGMPPILLHLFYIHYLSTSSFAFGTFTPRLAKCQVIVKILILDEGCLLPFENPKYKA
jgi:hypothetical protein